MQYVLKENMIIIEHEVEQLYKSLTIHLVSVDTEHASYPNSSHLFCALRFSKSKLTTFKLLCCQEKLGHLSMIPLMLPESIISEISCIMWK